MEYCKKYKNRRRVYEELETFKIDGKCIKDRKIISNSLNDYFISKTIRVNGGKLNIGKSDINHLVDCIKFLKKKKLFLILNLNIHQRTKLKIHYISKTV